VSHNAYWFQGAPSLWGEERTVPHPCVLNALAEVYAGLDPDILCLQEVPSPEAFGELRDHLGMEGVFRPGAGLSAYGGAILWRGIAAATDDLSHRQVGDGRVFERMSLRLNTRVDGHPLSLVNAHLSSNRYAPDGQGESIRLAELAAVAEACPDADVVAGDFNATPDSAVYAQMQALGFDDVGLGHDGPGRPEERRVDYIWVRSGSGPTASDYEVVSGARFGLASDPGIALSDHHPLRASVHL